MSVKVPEPGQSRDLDLVMDHGRTVSGRIRFAGGKPAAHLSIWGSWMKAWSYADLDGRFTLSAVPRRKATLSVAQGDRRLKVVQVPAEGEGFLKALDIVLDDRSRKLPLRVVFSDGAPAKGARVALTYMDRGWDEAVRRMVAVDADGRCLVDELRPGQVALIVNGPGLAPFGKSIEVGRNEPVTVTLPDGRIQGRATTLDGQPARVRVRLSTMISMGGTGTTCWSRETDSDLVETDAGGRFSFRGVGEGSYEFEFEPDGLAVIRGPDEARTGDVDLTLVIGPESEVPSQYIVVRLVDATTGKPAKDAGVGIPEHGGSEQSSWCIMSSFDEEEERPGVFTSACLPPGTYELQASGQDYQNRTVENVKLTANRNTEVEIRLEPVPRLHGRVVDEQGRPVAGVAVSSTIHSIFGTLAHLSGATTDENGAFSLRGISTADNRIQVRGEHHRGSCAVPAREKWSEPLIIVVQTVGALHVSFPVRMVPEREVRVVVRNVERRSRRTLRFRATRYKERLAKTMNGRSDEENQQALQTAMLFALSRALVPVQLRPGHYRVEAFWDDRTLAPREIEVKKGQTVELDFNP